MHQSIPRTLRLLAVACLITTVAAALLLRSSHTRADGVKPWGPRWTQDGKLRLPKGFRRWVFIGSPLTPDALNGGQAAFPEYHNVYVQPQAFDAYRRTGTWPEGTIMLKELQRVTAAKYPDGSSKEVSGRGYFPAGLNGIDISVKDSRRFSGTNGWGFFNFGHHPPPYPTAAAPAPREACATCHTANATNMVFSKFYDPILKAK